MNMKTTIASVAAALWLSLVAAAHAQTPQAPISIGDGHFPNDNDGSTGVATFGGGAQIAWRQRDYARLDDWFDHWAKPEERFDDGRWHLAALSAGLDSAFTHRSPKDWKEEQERISEWRQKNPASTAVDIVEAQLLTNWAWSARGSGYARSVTPEGWKLFHERLNRAEELLFRSKERSSGNPLWYAEYLTVALANDWDPAEFRALHDAAIARFPDFHPFYFKMIQHLQPRWGGSIEQIDAYIAEVAKQTEAQQGKIMYARLYWYLAGIEGADFSLFEDSAVNWADMKTGFEQLIAATPKSNWNFNNFASFACRAGDADTYRKLRKQLDARFYEDAWPSNYRMEICDERLLKAI